MSSTCSTNSVAVLSRSASACIGAPSTVCRDGFGQVSMAFLLLDLPHGSSQPVVGCVLACGQVAVVAQERRRQVLDAQHRGLHDLGNVLDRSARDLMKQFVTTRFWHGLSFEDSAGGYLR